MLQVIKSLIYLIFIRLLDSVMVSVVQASGIVVFEVVLRTVAWYPDQGGCG